MIRALALRPYRLPLRQPWRTARGVVTQREGWLVVVECDGRRGYGDCAPLPEAGSEEAEAAAATLAEARAELPGQDVQAALDGLAGRWLATPAARGAVECALLDVLAQRAHVPLFAWLNPAASSSVAANAALGALDGGLAERARAALDEGYTVLKIKVGLAAVEAEIKALTALCAAVSATVRLRLDANGAWQRDEAQRFITGVADLPVESLEEPLARYDAAALGELQGVAPFSLALDESLAVLDQHDLLATPPVRRLVLKPAVLGGILPAWQLATAARDAGVECVVTTLLDSAVGTFAACHLAAALDNRLHHGLASGAWFTEDVGISPHFTGGRVFLSNTRPGLGFSMAGA